MMQDYLFILPISLFLLLGVISPGPSFILVAQTAMAKSRLQASAVALGMGLGASIFAFVASLGLLLVLDAVPTVYLALKVLGGAYLCFLALKIWCSASEPMTGAQATAVSDTSLTKMFCLGLFTQLSNPKTAIVFGSVFAAFLPAHVPEFSYYLICMLAFVIDTAWYLLVALLLSTVKAQAIYANSEKYISRMASSFMALMGVRLITSGD